MVQFWHFHPLIVHGFLPKMGCFLTYDFITPFERTHFELSEKPEITVIGQSELELCLLKIFFIIFHLLANLTEFKMSIKTII